MARSPFTLVAAVTAALPGAEVVGARALTSDGDGRFDSAVATLADGRELVIRVAEDDAAALELAEEALALRALTAGAREMLPFRAPTHVGETRVGEARAQVTDLMPGFQIDAPLIPAGPGAAVSIGETIAAVHALPESVVRAAGLAMHDATTVRTEVQQMIDRAAATGRVPGRLTTRWRDAAADDDLWRFETTVVLGGMQAQSFLFEDDPDAGPRVIGVLGWRGLAVGDPAEDLGWLSGAPEASADVHDAYTAASTRAIDDALRVRARLHAELGFARWLVHGAELRRPEIVEDAAALLESLSDGLRNDDLRVVATYTGGVDSALDVLDQVPETVAASVDTSMQTDAYRPEDLVWHTDAGDEDADAAEDENAAAEDSSADRPSWEEPTQDLTGAARLAEADIDSPETTASDAAGEPTAVRHGDGEHADADQGKTEHSDESEHSDMDSAEEAQRAARAALQRWTNSGSE
ncbi:hypothetical protein JF550_06795 [Microbacterium esteraromaticum]|uniref:Aminoglycoside phosphotransferase domain-containing protein n=1 Tax=Microbacterium esteraromaticum TaxID=57043 RepID=A0A939DVB3_9MICO|nr:phosphotransferase [Microbacterium esteraromaticum]MBN8205664.1 hypothetical protein [Microbacterium esteraromaticum]MBN8415818.1 hypothetical protein [Microbacterium esteraromaticum]